MKTHNTPPPSNTSGVSLIIPAFNEEKTIGPLLKKVKDFSVIGEVIVVDDCSTDNTLQEIKKIGVSWISFSKNHGKGFALSEGVKRARYETLVFLDADITGLTEETLTRLTTPVKNNTYDMHIALIHRRYRLMNILKKHSLWPLIEGQRVLRRSLFEAVPNKYKKGFSFEIALNHICKKTGKTFLVTEFPEISHIPKAEKQGALRGSVNNIKMSFLVIFLGLYFSFLRLFP